MGSPVRALRATVLAFAITGAASCGGDLVRLGDGPTAAGVAGSAGLSAGAGQSGNGGNGGNSGISGTGGTEDGGQAEGGAGGTCLRGQVAPEEVLWIGDSWLLLPGTQTRRVRDLARAAGSLAPDKDYVNRAVSASPLAAIVNQYETRQAGMTKVKVLLMNGGTWDTIIASGSMESVTAVNAQFRAFLDQVASDGTVEHIVYFLQPELPTIDGVAALRPDLVAACEQSSVPCHFLDLQPFWLGHPEYTDASMIQASEAGATVIADEIWKIMQDNCIAQ